MDGMKRKGRPPLLEGERASLNFTMRLQPSLYESLKRAAAVNCRSISAEAEFRLKASFREVACNLETGPNRGMWVVPNTML